MQRCLIFNPAACGEKARRMAAHLDVLKKECTLRPTACAGDARVLAAQAVREGFDLIIAAGGDGTINEVLNGIGDVPNGFSGVCLGVLPLGTANVFARELRIPLQWEEAWKVARQGHVARIDLPRAEFKVGTQTQHRYFVQLAGAGLDSRAIELVDWELKKKFGGLAYVAAGLRAMRERHPAIQVSSNGCEHSGELVLLGNGRLYGGSFVVFPKASVEDGQFDVCIVPRLSWFKLFAIGLRLVSGSVENFSGILHFQTPTVTLSSADRVLLELDGENVGELPATITVQARALQVVVPR